MKTMPLILLSLGLAIGVSAATTIALRPDSAPAAQDHDVSSTELAALRSQINALTSEIARLKGQADTSTSLPRASSAGRVDLEEIDRAVARYMESHLGELPAKTVAQTEAAAKKPKRDVKALLELLNDVSLSEESQQELWTEIRESGQLDAAIALLEARAERFGDDPDAQVEVASAYIQKIFEVGEGPAAGLWAGKADKAYDRALALDEKHWDARFAKAVSLSFWPPIFGKQGVAISNFETLISQQENAPVQDRFAQSYVLLGNLYSQAGDSEKAQATWKKGLGYFPADASLLSKFNQ